MVFGMIQKLQNDIFCLTEERDYFQGKFLEQVSDIAALKEELQQAKKEINKLRHELMRMSTTNHTTMMIEDDHPHMVTAATAGTADANLVEYVDGGKKMPEKDFKNDDVEDDDDASSLTRSEALLARDEEEDDELDVESDLEEQPNVKPQTVTDAYSTPIKRSHRNRHYDDNDDDSDHEDDDDDDDDASSHDSANDIRQSAERLLQWASYRALSNSTTPSASVATGSVETSSHATPTSSSRNSQSRISDSNICHPKDKEPGIDHNDPQPTTTTANRILMTRRPLPLLGKLEQEEEEEDRQDIPHTDTHHHHHIMEEKQIDDEEEGTKENNHHGSKNNNTRAAAAVVVQI